MMTFILALLCWIVCAKLTQLLVLFAERLTIDEQSSEEMIMLLCIFMWFGMIPIMVIGVFVLLLSSPVKNYKWFINQCKNYREKRRKNKLEVLKAEIEKLKQEFQSVGV